MWFLSTFHWVLDLCSAARLPVFYIFPHFRCLFLHTQPLSEPHMPWGLSLDQLFLWSKHTPTQPLIDSSSIHSIPLLLSFFPSLSFSLSHLEKSFSLFILPSLMCAYCLTYKHMHACVNMYISYWWLSTRDDALWKTYWQELMNFSSLSFLRLALTCVLMFI